MWDKSDWFRRPLWFGPYPQCVCYLPLHFCASWVFSHISHCLHNSLLPPPMLLPSGFTYALPSSHSSLQALVTSQHSGRALPSQCAADLLPDFILPHYFRRILYSVKLALPFPASLPFFFFIKFSYHFRSLHLFFMLLSAELTHPSSLNSDVIWKFSEMHLWFLPWKMSLLHSILLSYSLTYFGLCCVFFLLSKISSTGSVTLYLSESQNLLRTQKINPLRKYTWTH